MCQQGTWNDWQKGSHFNIVTELEEKEIVVIARDFNRPIGGNADDYEDQHGGYIYEVRNKKKDSGIYAVMRMTVGKGLLIEGKSPSHLWVCFHKNGGRSLFDKKKPMEDII